MERAFEQRLRRVVDWRDVVQSSARRVVAVLSTLKLSFSSLKEKKLDPRNKAFVKVMSRNSFERIFRSGPMLLLSCMLFSSPLLSTLVSIFFAFSFRRRKRQSFPFSPKLCTSTMFFNHVSTSLHRGRSVENLGEIFSSLRDAPVNILNFIDVTRYDLICY